MPLEKHLEIIFFGFAIAVKVSLGECLAKVNADGVFRGGRNIFLHHCRERIVSTDRASLNSTAEYATESRKDAENSNLSEAAKCQVLSAKRQMPKS